MLKVVGSVGRAIITANARYLVSNKEYERLLLAYSVEKLHFQWRVNNFSLSERLHTQTYGETVLMYLTSRE